jgi:hypothetical protein
MNEVEFLTSSVKECSREVLRTHSSINHLFYFHLTMNVDTTEKEADLQQELKLQVVIKYNRKGHKQTKLTRGDLNLQLWRG